jgi:hypothetical protein
MSTAVVLLDIKKAFDKTWHFGLLCKLFELHFSINLIKLISYFLYQKKFRVSDEGEISMPRDIQTEVPQSYVICVTFYSIYINYTPQTPGVYLGLFADDTFIYATDRKAGYVLRKLQRALSAIETWCEDKTQAVYFSHRLRPPEPRLTPIGRNIPFGNHVK